MSSSAAPSARRRVTLVVALLLTALVSAASPAAAAGLPNLRDTYPAAIDPYLSYEAQTQCLTTTQPGTKAVADLIRKAYPTTRVYDGVRACSQGGVSEHKDGRAIDWMLDVNDPAQKKIADEFIAWITAPDKHGNRDAMARRMGIMYIIWDGAMWRGWGGSQAGTWDRSRDRGHRDHIHISMSWPGALAQTSWFTGKPYCQPGTSPCPVTRYAGTDRYSTAVAAGRWAAPSARTAVLVSGEQASLVDGLVAAPLAKAMQAPLLLTSRSALPAVVRDDLRRRGVSRVTVVGGAGAVDPAVASALTSSGIQVTRVDGPDRYATAAAVARQVRALSPGTGAAVASGDASLVDALTVGAASAGAGNPVVLTRRGELPEATASALRDVGARQVVVAGGSGVVADTVVTRIQGLGGSVRVTRLGGTDRWDTAVRVARHHQQVLGLDTVAVTSGVEANLVDAMPAGASGRVLLPTAPTQLPGSVQTYLTQNAPTVNRVAVVGGKGAVSDPVASRIGQVVSTG